MFVLNVIVVLLEVMFLLGIVRVKVVVLVDVLVWEVLLRVMSLMVWLILMR